MLKISFNKKIMILFCLFLFCFTDVAFANSQKKLSKIKEALSQKRESLKKSKNREKKIKKEVVNLYKNLGKAKKKIKKLSNSIDKYSSDFEKNSEKLKDAKQKELHYKQLLSYEIELLYKQRFLTDNAFFDMLNFFYSEKSFLDTKLKEYNIKTILLYNKDRYSNFATKKRRFYNRTVQLNKDIIYLNNVKKNYKNKETKLAKKHKRKKKELTKEQQKQKEYQKKIEKLEKTAKELENLISRLLKKAKQKRAKRGDLTRYNEVIQHFGYIKKPVYGDIIVKYGKNKHPKLNAFHVSNGVEINSKAKNSVRTVEAGEVVFSNKFNSYGNTVIIDHGKGVYTVYSYLNKLNVEKGQKVLKSAAIGSVGYSGYSKKYALYFEVRIDGVAMDPEIWFK